MQLATGSVIDGKIVLDGATLPDGTIVTVLAPDHDEHHTRLIKGDGDDEGAQSDTLCFAQPTDSCRF